MCAAQFILWLVMKQEQTIIDFSFFVSKLYKIHFLLFKDIIQLSEAFHEKWVPTHIVFIFWAILFLSTKLQTNFQKRHWEFFHLLFFSFKNEALLRIKSRKHPWSILLCGTWILRECFKGNFIDKYRDCLLDHAALMLLLWKENQSVWTSFT